MENELRNAIELYEEQLRNLAVVLEAEPDNEEAKEVGAHHIRWRSQHSQD